MGLLAGEDIGRRWWYPGCEEGLVVRTGDHDVMPLEEISIS